MTTIRGVVMRYVNITNARKQLPKLVKSVEASVIMRHGKPVGVLIAYDEYRGLRALRVLARDPSRLQEIMELHEKVMRGDLEDFVEVDLGTLEAELG